MSKLFKLALTCATFYLTENENMELGFIDMKTRLHNWIFIFNKETTIPTYFYSRPYSLISNVHFIKRILHIFSIFLLLEITWFNSHFPCSTNLFWPLLNWFQGGVQYIKQTQVYYCKNGTGKDVGLNGNILYEQSVFFNVQTLKLTTSKETSKTTIYFNLVAFTWY